MARAVTDSIGFQVGDVVSAIAAQTPAPLGNLFADGGPSRNSFLMQCVADTLDHPLVQCDAPEVSALGTAYLAGLTLGVWPDLGAIAALPRSEAKLSPRPSDAKARLAVWRDAVRRSTLPRLHDMDE